MILRVRSVEGILLSAGKLSTRPNTPFFEITYQLYKSLVLR